MNEVIEWSGKHPAQYAGPPGFRALGEELWRAEDIDRLIEDTDALFRTSKQAKEPILDHGPDTSGRDRDPLRERIRRAVRTETVVEICGPDLDLARLLALEWDGSQHTPGAALGSCLARTPVPGPAGCPPLRRIGALLRPGAELRQAWASGAVVSWEGRLRAHVAVWHPAAPTAGPGAADVRARLDAPVSQAQQRVLSPWIEEARQRLAVRALGHLNRPVAALVADYADRPPAHLGAAPERAFVELQVGELLRAHVSGALALPRATRGSCGSS
ncbi:hypothetical protein ABZ567_00120 [Streptomyces sp. NPDC016459]|uniref:hypothetical protein n=1 Tax=Streptomyces sp. NPDC016459 TaxID=3157190 RepID=UPI0033F97354